MRSAGHLLAIACVTCGVLAVAPARADDDGPRPTPRTFVKIGDASVVLIASSDKLYAFVDRIEDNAPVEDAELEIDNADGTSIEMNRAPVTANKLTAGVFVGTLNRAGHMQDAFMITLTSSAGSGQEPAEIIYTDTPEPVALAPLPDNRLKIAIAVVSAALGAAGTVLFMLWLRGGGRRAPRRAVARARVA